MTSPTESGTPRTDAIFTDESYLTSSNAGRNARLARHARQLERELAQAVREREGLQAAERRLQAMMPLFEEARDALPAITETARKLRGISASLADRMDEVGIDERWKKLDAALSALEEKQTAAPPQGEEPAQEKQT